MTESVLNHLVAHPPAPGYRISFARLGGTESLSLSELYELSGRLAGHLSELGLRRGDRIGIVASNRLEWVLLDLAAVRLGVVTAGFEPGKFDPEGTLTARYGLKLLFTERPSAAPDTHPIAAVRDWVSASSGPVDLEPIRYRAEDVTTLKFTSGSTGAPKGLAATVGSIDGSLRVVQEMFAHGPGDHLFVFLPLSLLQQRYWIYSALRFGHDVTVSTHDALFSALRRARPTVVMGVPAFYEVTRRRIEKQAARTGIEPGAAARGVFGPRIRYLWTGSAPAAVSTLRYFTDLGLPIYEGYGLNETCIVTKNHPGADRLGSVGRVVPGKEVLLDADGLISVRSDQPVNRAYAYAPPGESERVFGAGGIVRTGDLGYFDEDGFLYIRGRADDVIVLDNAKKIIVRPIEEHLKTSPAIEECVLYCPARTYLVAVVSPADDPPDRAAIDRQLAATNAAFGRDEQIAKVIVAREPFSVDNGLLTGQFKPKRQAIRAAYRREIEDRDGVVRAS
ncbi:AMP-binding protein [Amycolatopsis anabasis]|uniref:AMP-binding protein n=1 Tax=Amycolatopsis anabasis TaxID=1840409 RepID=UPI00131D882F|nr:AMP-binding protein [Amycolatopsis anabasis]